jgi:hypothetical protein
MVFLRHYDIVYVCHGMIRSMFCINSYNSGQFILQGYRLMGVLLIDYYAV